jgi:CheY-like chemotaxis protein
MEDLYNSLYRLHKMPVAETQIDKIQAEPLINNSAALTILVAEDNIVNKLLAKTIINRIAPEAQLLEASNGKEALALFEQANLILMDIQMPVMNGYEATIAIRAREGGRHVPIIALTAGNVKGEKEKCLQAGMDDFIAKPFVEDTIIRLFKDWLDPALPESEPRQQTDGPGTGNEFDLQVLRSFVGNDEDVINDVLMLTRQELKTSLKAIQELASENNLVGIKESGHKLFGTASVVGLERLAIIARQMEYLTSNDATAIDSLFKQLVGEIEICDRLIAGHIKK